jgi:hypothetical protein
MLQTMESRKQHDGGTAIMVMHNIANMLHRGAKFRNSRSTGKPLSFAEKNRLFSEAARAVVSCMLHGRVEIHNWDIQLDAEAANGGAILINERVSNNAEFQKMWEETSCRAILKTLAQRGLQG